MSDSSDKPKKGRRSVFPDELGDGVHDKFRYPEAVNRLLRQDDVKLLLAWMALKPSIREKAIKLIPKKEREAKLKKTDNPSPSVSSEPVISQDPPDSTNTGL